MVCQNQKKNAKKPEKTIPLPNTGEKVKGKKGKKAIPYDVQALRTYAESGMTYKEIAGILKVDTSTVHKWCKKEGIVPNKEVRKTQPAESEYSEDTGIGRNADRHLCKTCMYRHNESGGCDYICYTGHARGCKPEDCTEYRKGNPKDS